MPSPREERQKAKVEIGAHREKEEKKTISWIVSASGLIRNGEVPNTFRSKLEKRNTLARFTWEEEEEEETILLEGHLDEN